jgi:threonine synthase
MPAIISRSAPSVATSIGALQGTVQGALAVRQSRGAAVFVSDPEIVDWSERLARIEGVFPEPSAAAVLPAIARLRERGDMKPDDTVVALFTAGGLKDPALAQSRLGPVPHQAPGLGDTVRALKEHYGFDCE